MQDIIGNVLKHEGGYVNDPADRGGMTNRGITEATYSAYLGRKATEYDMRTLSEETAREIYERQYLTGPRIHLLPEAIVSFTLDCSVNHGPRTGGRFVQQAINGLGFGPVTVDGILGPQTRKAAERMVEKLGDKKVMRTLVNIRIDYYHWIIDRNPSQAKFKKGWLRRANSFLPI